MRCEWHLMTAGVRIKPMGNSHCWTNRKFWTNLIYAWRTVIFFSVSPRSPLLFSHSLQTAIRLHIDGCLRLQKYDRFAVYSNCNVLINELLKAWVNIDSSLSDFFWPPQVRILQSLINKYIVTCLQHANAGHVHWLESTSVLLSSYCSYIICQIFLLLMIGLSLSCDWICPAKNGEYRSAKKHDSLHLMGRLARTFVLGHCLFLKAHSPWAVLLENHLLLKTDTVDKYPYWHIFCHKW